MSQIDWAHGARVTVTAGGRKLDGLCMGPPPQAGPVIVMLHEGLGSIEMWKDFPERVADATGHGVFVYSRAGYGQSDPADLPLPVDYMTREAVDVLPDILDAIGGDSVVLFGHSDGATIAAIHAGSVSDSRVRGLILMAPHFFTEKGGLEAIAAAKTAFEEGDLAEKLARYHRDATGAFRGWNDAWLDPKFHDWNVADAIDHWRIPVLAIQGRDDEYGTLAQIEEIEERIYSPLEVAILDDCGHAPHRDRPDETLAAIAEFCARLDRLENEKVAVA